LKIDFSFQVECPLLVGNVSRGYHETETNPEEESVDCEERSTVEHDTGESEEGGEDHHG
jgi:hypothetical protein